MNTGLQLLKIRRMKECKRTEILMIFTYFPGYTIYNHQIVLYKTKHTKQELKTISLVSFWYLNLPLPKSCPILPNLV